MEMDKTELLNSAMTIARSFMIKYVDQHMLIMLIRDIVKDIKYNDSYIDNNNSDKLYYKLPHFGGSISSVIKLEIAKLEWVEEPMDFWVRCPILSYTLRVDISLFTKFEFCKNDSPIYNAYVAAVKSLEDESDD